MGIARWLQRRMIFMCGYAEKEILNFNFIDTVLDELEEIEDIHN